MKYIRTEDGIYEIEKYGGIRIIIKIYEVDESLRAKYVNTDEAQQVGDKFIIINNKDYKIFDNDIANEIEDLITDNDLALFSKITVDCLDSYYRHDIENALMSILEAKRLSSSDGWYEDFSLKDIQELYIRSKDGKSFNKVAERNKEGVLVLL